MCVREFIYNFSWGRHFPTDTESRGGGSTTAVNGMLHNHRRTQTSAKFSSQMRKSERERMRQRNARQPSQVIRFSPDAEKQRPNFLWLRPNSSADWNSNTLEHTHSHASHHFRNACTLVMLLMLLYCCRIYGSLYSGCRFVAGCLVSRRLLRIGALPFGADTININIVHGIYTIAMSLVWWLRVRIFVFLLLVSFGRSICQQRNPYSYIYIVLTAKLVRDCTCRALDSHSFPCSSVAILPLQCIGFCPPRIRSLCV